MKERCLYFEIEFEVLIKWIIFKIIKIMLNNIF